MTKGYLACCYFRRKYTDPGEDAIHSNTVYLTWDEAMKDLKRMYDEQKNYLIQDLDENEEIVKDQFDSKHGKFTLETDWGERYALGVIDNVNINSDKV